MSFAEKSAWALGSSVFLAYGWYLATVLSQLGGSSVADVDYQRTAVVGAIVVVVLIAVAHIALAATGPSHARGRHTGSSAIKRYARSAGGLVIGAAAALGMTLAMFEADYFWIANVILAGLVVAELVSAGSEIAIYRRNR